MSETGVVKFRCEHVATKLAPFPGMAELNAARQKLLQLGLIGVDRNGIGFGNLSVRVGGTNNFYITGSGSGSIAELGPEDYAKVTAYDFDRNWLQCEGATVASSESLTHAAIYEADASANAVIHFHSAPIWKKLLDHVPTISAQIEYGTPAMANAVKGLFCETNVKTRRLFVMAGHDDGIVSFGCDVDEALRSSEI